MTKLLSPLPDLQLDPRNTKSLLSAMQSRMYFESRGSLNDFSPASPLATITEGQAYAAGEILYYLNSLPEAFALQWMKLIGIQRVIGSASYCEVTFEKEEFAYEQDIVVPRGMAIISTTGLRFYVTDDIIIPSGETSATAIAISEKWGSIYNLPPGALLSLSSPIVGLRVFNITSAQGGTDLEDVTTMKSRANSVISRRALITKEDILEDISNVFPEIDYVDIIENDVRNNNVPIIIGMNDGSELPTGIVTKLFSQLFNKTPMGMNFSVLQLEIIPLVLRVSARYNSREISSNTLAEVMRKHFIAELTPGNITRDTTINIYNLINSIPFVNGLVSGSYEGLEINGFYPHKAEYGPDDCDPLFRSYRDSTTSKCIRYRIIEDEEKFGNETYNDYFYFNEYSSGKLYQFEISLIDQNDNILIYNFDGLYDVHMEHTHGEEE